MPVSPSLRGTMCMWRCGTACPATSPSFHAQLKPSALSAFLSAFFTRTTVSKSSVFSTCESSSSSSVNRYTTVAIKRVSYSKKEALPHFCLKRHDFRCVNHGERDAPDELAVLRLYIHSPLSLLKRSFLRVTAEPLIASSRDDEVDDGASQPFACRFVEVLPLVDDARFESRRGKNRGKDVRTLAGRTMKLRIVIEISFVQRQRLIAQCVFKAAAGNRVVYTGAFQSEGQRRNEIEKVEDIKCDKEHRNDASYFGPRRVETLRHERVQDKKEECHDEETDRTREQEHRRPNRFKNDRENKNEE